MGLVKNIHQILLNNNTIPIYMKQNYFFCETHYIWTDQNIWNTLNTTKKDFCVYWNIQDNDYTKQKQIIRLLLLKKFGGLYINPKITLLNHNIFDNINKNFIICTTCQQTPIHIKTTDIYTFDVFGSSQSNILLSKILMNIKNNQHENITEVYRRTIVENQDNINYLTINEFNTFFKVYK